MTDTTPGFVAFVVKTGNRSFSATLAQLAAGPVRAVDAKVGILGQATGPQRKTALRAALTAAGLPEDTTTLVVEQAPPAGLTVRAPAAIAAEPQTLNRTEWLTPATDPVAWKAEFLATVKDCEGRASFVQRDCEAVLVAASRDWVNWAMANGVLQYEEILAAAGVSLKAPKVAEADRPRHDEAAKLANSEQAKAKVLAKSLPSKIGEAWVRAVYKTAYNFGLATIGMAPRYLDVGTEAPPFPGQASKAG